MNRVSRTLVELALEEDLGGVGDVTGDAFVDAAHRSVGRIFSRESAVISGHGVAAAVCRTVDPSLAYRAIRADGERVESGGAVVEVEGSTRSLLAAERTVLNFLQRLSGVATITSHFVGRVAHTSAAILDTRKTTPGWRELEKQAVAHGGGTNHRLGLFDAAMVKDNHLAAGLDARDLADRVAALRRHRPGLTVEVEADRLDQVEAFLEIDGIDWILLDNMGPEGLTAAVAARDAAGSAVRLEASGGVDLESVSMIAESGVDFISVGALTHSVKSIDLGLDLVDTRADPSEM